MVLSFSSTTSSKWKRLTNAHTVCSAHWEDISLKVSSGEIPLSLATSQRLASTRRRGYVLDDELSKTVRPGIFVGLSNDPSWSIGYTKVQDFSRPHNIVQGKHNLLDGRRVIPPVNVEDINVIGLQLEQRGFERVLEGFLVVTSIVDLDTGEFAFLGVDIWGGVLSIDQSFASGHSIERTWRGRSHLGSFAWPSSHR
jgi:hypothetical protein